MNTKEPSEIKPKGHHKRKWRIVAGIVIALLLLLPAIIGMLIRSSVDQQLALQNQTPVWNAGWLSSQMHSITPTGTETEITFRHGPLWFNPFGAGITDVKGTLQFPGTAKLPLTGNVSLGGKYQVKQIIPVSYVREVNGEWSISQVNSNAFVQLNSTLGSQSIKANAQYPQGLVRPGSWQISWQDVLSQLAISNTEIPYEDGNWAVQAKALRWQPMVANTVQHVMHQLDGKLNWPQDHDITLQLSAPNISFIGQPQQSGQLQIQAGAISIDRIALIQWLQTSQQNNAGQSPAQILALASMLAAQPELNIQQASLETPEGLIQLQANLQFKPNQRQAQVTGDMPEAAAQWLAQAVIIDQEAARKWLQSLIQDGWLRRSGDQLILGVTVNL